MSPSSRDRSPDRAPAIRPALKGDVDALVAIENASFPGDRLSRRSFLRLVESRSAVALVAEAEGAGTGTVIGGCITLLRALSRRARLYSLAVAPAHTGRGIGAALLDAAERAASARGCQQMSLEVREDNAAARGLYAGRGYEPVGRTPGYYGDGEAALHLRKSLAAPPASAEAAA